MCSAFRIFLDGKEMAQLLICFTMQVPTWNLEPGILELEEHEEAQRGQGDELRYCSRKLMHNPG